jgi:tetratricopeptide (TPR) repeat protein
MYREVNVRYAKITIALILTAALAGPVVAQQSKCQTQQCFVQSAKIYYKVYKKSKLREDLYHCIDLLKEASESFPHRPELYYFLGTFYAEINAIDTMAAYFDSVKTYCDDESIDKSQRSNCYNGDKYIEKMEKLRDGIWERTYNDGVNYMGQYDTVQAMVGRTSADNQDSLKVLDSLKQEAFKLSSESFELATLAKPIDPRSYLAMAALQEREKKYADAVDEFKTAYDLFSTDTIPGDKKQFALEKKYVSMDSLRTLMLPGLVSSLAMAYMNSEDWENSITWFTKYLTYSPDDASALINISVAYNRLNNYEKWYEYMSKALKLQPDNTQLLFNAGQYWFLKMQEANDSLMNISDSTAAGKERRKPFEEQVTAARDSATVAFAKIVKINPQDAEALKRLGILYLIATEPQKAVDVFNQYLEIKPNDVSVLDYLSRGYVNLGHSKDAITPLEKIVNIDPGNLDAWERLADIYKYNNMPDKANQAQAKVDELKKL